MAQGGTAVPSVYGGAHLQQGPVSLDVSGRRTFVQHDGTPFPPDFATTALPSYAKPNNSASANEEQSYGASLVYTPTNWWRHNLTIGADRFTDDLRTTAPVLTSPADTFLVFVEENENKTDRPPITRRSRFRSRGTLSAISLTIGADHYNLDDQIYFTGLATNTTGTIETNPAEPVTASRSPTTNTD